ncbi:MAG TPA: VWA domain-containing protein [bacterium]|nr:VWA domain-containing protein [bacterium]
MQFLNPALLAGALLFAVPLVIHLLNRQRHKRRPWAAMEFLLRAYQKQRNRLRNENLLLLLLRCLIPILLALAIARPILREAAVLFTGGGVVHHVFVLDSSYSMGLSQDGAPTPFARARTMVGKLLERFEQNPNRNDKVTLVTAGVRPRFLVRGDLDLAAARAGWLAASKPEDAAGDLKAALSQVADALETESDGNAQVYVFTDLQQRALGADAALADGEPGAELSDTLADVVARIADRDGLQLHWIDTGPMAASVLDPTAGGELDNVQIQGLRLADPAAIEKAPAEVTATLRNVGSAAATAEVTLEIDGGEPVRKVIELPAGAEGEADFHVTFRTPGRHRLRASLVQDALAADDERFLTVEVRDRIRVLLIDGKDGGDPLKSYAYLWRAMLDPDENALPTFAVDAVDLVTLLGGQCTPKDYDVVVLADVERLNHRAAKALADTLRAGRGVLCMFGPQCDIESYNLHLYAAGEGPMPFRLLPALGGAPGSSTVRAPSIVDENHPALAEFDQDIYREILQAIPLWRWYGVAAESLHQQAAIALRVTDAERTPLLVSRAFDPQHGGGQAAFLMSAIGSEYDAERWNRFDDPLVAFALLHGMVKWLALPAHDPFAVDVGGELSCTLPARPENIELERPVRDGRPRALIAEASQPVPGGRFLLPPFANTIYAGFYTFDMQLDRESGKEPLRLPFAVNVDPAEGELRYPAHADAQRALGVERILTSLPAIASADDTPDQSELGPSLLLLTLLFVLGEAALARYVTARRG